MTTFIKASVVSTLLFSASLFAQTSKPVNISSIPKAFPHEPGFVISPYKPYNVLEVKHLRPGNAAYDPTTAKVDPKTGKPDMATAKIFIVPNPKPKTPTQPAATSGTPST